jgi:hypothetical protein
LKGGSVPERSNTGHCEEPYPATKQSHRYVVIASHEDAPRSPPRSRYGLKEHSAYSTSGFSLRHLSKLLTFFKTT